VENTDFLPNSNQTFLRCKHDDSRTSLEHSLIMNFPETRKIL